MSFSVVQLISWAYQMLLAAAVTVGRWMQRAIYKTHVCEACRIPPTSPHPTPASAADHTSPVAGFLSTGYVLTPQLLKYAVSLHSLALPRPEGPMCPLGGSGGGWILHSQLGEFLKS